MIIAGNQLFSGYNYSDYIRQSEYVQATTINDIPSQNYFFNVSHQFIDKNPCNIFQFDDLLRYFDQYIEICTACRLRIFDAVKTERHSIYKYTYPEDNDSDPLFDFSETGFVTGAFPSCSLMHGMNLNRSDQISFRRCRLLSGFSCGYLISSGDLYNGLKELFTS